MQRHVRGEGGAEDPAHAFPELCGRHLSEAAAGPPALAFVRAVLAVFALDRRTEGGPIKGDRARPRNGPIYG